MPSGGKHDFDFEFGSWTVKHRRLKDRLSGCMVWDEFTGTATTQPILGGAGNVEDNVLNFPEGTYRAVALRSFDVDSGAWAIWWLDARFPHQLDVPVTGAFSGGIGSFLADDNFRGKPIKVRFLWLDTTAANPRWEQAFSADDGLNWETNWTMEFTRVAADQAA